MAIRPSNLLGDKKTLSAFSKALRDANQQIEREILSATDFGIADRRAIQRKIDKILREVGEQGLADIERTIPKMYKDGATDTIKQLRQLGITPSVGADFTVIDKRSVAALVSDTQQAFAEAMSQVGRSSGRILSRASKDAIKAQLAQDQILGRTLVSRTKMIKGILKDQGITALRDARGAKWSLDRYGEMLVRTKMVEARNTGLANKMMENGYDLVMVTTHMSEHFECARWEGRVLSLSGGSKTYPPLSQAEETGLFHPNCKHAINAIPSRLAYRTEIYDSQTGEYISTRKAIREIGRDTQWVNIATRYANDGNWRGLDALLRTIPKRSKAYKELQALFGSDIIAAKTVRGIKPTLTDRAIVLKEGDRSMDVALNNFEMQFVQDSDLRVAAGRLAYRFDNQTLGVYVPSRHTLYVRSLRDAGVLDTFYHELGHALDHKVDAARLIQNEAFERAYKAEANNILTARLVRGGMPAAQAKVMATGASYNGKKIPRSWLSYAGGKSEVLADGYAQWRMQPRIFARTNPLLNTFFKEVLR